MDIYKLQGYAISHWKSIVHFIIQMKVKKPFALSFIK